MAIVAAVVIVAGASVVYVRATGNESVTAIDGASGSLSAEETILEYLHALAAGDALKALSFSQEPPPDTSLLTDEVLAQQVAEWPLSEINIDTTVDNVAMARTTATVSVKFGDKAFTDDISVTKNTDGLWRIDYVANEFKPHQDSAQYKTLTVFGKEITFGESFYLFPGYVGVKTSNEYLDAPVRTDYLPVFSAFPTLSASALEVEFELNDNGTTAVTTAVEEAFAKCETSRQIAPPDCPAYLNVSNAVDGSVKWGRADIGELSMYRNHDLTVNVVGNTYIPVTYETTDGRVVDTRQPWVNQETVDISVSPPRVIAK